VESLFLEFMDVLFLAIEVVVFTEERYSIYQIFVKDK
jgi:hypothetical protein